MNELIDTFNMLKTIMTAKKEAAKPLGRTKPFFSMGHRGFAKTPLPIGRIPAPTLDQVRKIERQIKRKLHVKFGALYEKDGKPYVPETANV